MLQSRSATVPRPSGRTLVGSLKTSLSPGIFAKMPCGASTNPARLHIVARPVPGAHKGSFRVDRAAGEVGIEVATAPRHREVIALRVPTAQGPTPMTCGGSSDAAQTSSSMVTRPSVLLRLHAPPYRHREEEHTQDVAVIATSNRRDPAILIRINQLMLSGTSRRRDQPTRAVDPKVLEERPRSLPGCNPARER
jgi:hypothetical protein